LAASLKARFGEDAEIKIGKTGQFDVLVDSKVIFSKKEVSRFPFDGEVEDRFATLRAGKPLPALEPAPAGPLKRMAQKLFG
jgi:hypothetical protein